MEELLKNDILATVPSDLLNAVILTMADLQNFNSDLAIKFINRLLEENVTFVSFLRSQKGKFLEQNVNFVFSDRSLTSLFLHVLSFEDFDCLLSVMTQRFWLELLGLLAHAAKSLKLAEFGSRLKTWIQGNSKPIFQQFSTEYVKWLSDNFLEDIVDFLIVLLESPKDYETIIMLLPSRKLNDPRIVRYGIIHQSKKVC